jgi:hypothetical protein
MRLDGEVTEVTGESAAYADILPGAVILDAGRIYDPANYIDVTIRQDGETKLVHLWLGAAGRDFGTQAPPRDCPERFHALWGDGWKQRKAPRRNLYAEAMARLDEAAARQSSPEERDWLRKSELATVEKFRRAALAAHPDQGGDKAEFQRLWPLYEAAARDYRLRWGR